MIVITTLLLTLVMNRRLYYDQWAADVNLEEELADLRERNEELHNMQLTQMVDEPRFGV